MTIRHLLGGKRVTILSSFAIILCFQTSALATENTSQIVVLGDSYSDTGNLRDRTRLPGVPYWKGRNSNGPLAVEYLAARERLPLRNYATGGATTGIGSVLDGDGVDVKVSESGLASQVSQVLGEGVLQAGRRLQEAGAKWVVVLGMPDLSRLPGVRQRGPEAVTAANRISESYNARLKEAVSLAAQRSPV